jgi:hypothetical protein
VGVAWSGQRIPTAVNLSFLDPEPLLFHSSSFSVILTRLRSRLTILQKNLVAPGIELGTSGSVARKSDHQTTEAVPSTLMCGLFLSVFRLKQCVPFAHDWYMHHSFHSA